MKHLASFFNAVFEPQCVFICELSQAACCLMCIVLDAERQLLETCCKEASRAVKDQPLSARSWAWFHFLTQLVFARSHGLSTVYNYNFFILLQLYSRRLTCFIEFANLCPVILKNVIKRIVSPYCECKIMLCVKLRYD